MNNQFKTKQYEELTILDKDGAIVGTMRIKPNKIVWYPKDGNHGFGVSIEDFAQFAVNNGTKQQH